MALLPPDGADGAFPTSAPRCADAKFATLHWRLRAFSALTPVELARMLRARHGS